MDLILHQETPMIEILPNQITPAFKSLFDRNIPSGVRCFAVLGGGNAGRLFTDDLEQPKMGYVWEQDDGNLYLGGVKDWQVLQQMVSLLRQHGTVELSFRDGDPDVECFPSDPEAGAECIELDRPAYGSDLTPFLSLSVGYEVFRMGRDLIERSPRLDETLFRYGSLDNYLEMGLDVCILHGDEFVCEAGADMDVGGVREVGIVTESPYRGRGFGTIAVAHLLKWCDELGCATYWDCVKLNIGSLKMARKLGYGNERCYKLLAWFSLNGEAGFE
jgi:GNAT superfamily N-acetyltransferase